MLSLSASTNLAETQTLITRLAKNLEDLEALKANVALELDELQASIHMCVCVYLRVCMLVYVCARIWNSLGQRGAGTR